MRRNEWPLVILILAVGVAYWNLLLPSPLQPYIAVDLGISLGAAAQLVTVSAGAAVGALLVYNQRGALVPPKFIILFGLGSLTLGSYLASRTDDYEMLMAFRVFNGLADGIIYPAAWVALAHYLPRERLGFGNQWILIGTALSSMIGIPLTNHWAGGGDWHIAFRWFSLAGVGMTALSGALFFAKEYPIPRSQGGGIRLILQNRRLSRLLAANVFVAVSWFGAITFVGGFLARTYEPSVNNVSWFFGLAGAAFTAGTFIYSRNPAARRNILLVTDALSIPLVVAFFAITGGFWYSVIIAGIFAFFRASGLVIRETMLLEETEQAAARIAGITTVELSTYLGTFGAALTGGIVLSQATYTLIGVLLAACALLSLAFQLLAGTDSTKPTTEHRIQPIKAEVS